MDRGGEAEGDTLGDIGKGVAGLEGEQGQGAA